MLPVLDIHFHLRIASFLISPYFSFIYRFQQQCICSDSAESQGGDTRGEEREAAPPSIPGVGGGSGSPRNEQTLFLGTTIRHLFLLFYSKKAKRQPLTKP